jgi:hypothetical protein
MHGSAAGRSQCVGSPFQSARRMHVHPKVLVMILHTQFAASVHQTKARGQLPFVVPKNNNTRLAGPQVHLHVKQTTEHIQRINKALGVVWGVCYKGNIVSIQNVRHLKAVEHGASARATHLQQLMEKLYKKPK